MNFDIYLEWALPGLESLKSSCEVLVIVDVLSFCTSVDIAVGLGARVYPFPDHGRPAEIYARSIGALSAVRRGEQGYSLSPASLQDLPAGARLVLPSPNGSALSYAARGRTAFAGCLRNAGPVAQAAQQAGGPVGLAAAGERWPDGSLRPALEDLLGAGAIIHHLSGRRSPEAAAAESAFLGLQSDGLQPVGLQAASLETALRRIPSGQELIERGFSADVVLAAQLNSSRCAPFLDEDAYRDYFA